MPKPHGFDTFNYNDNPPKPEERKALEDAFRQRRGFDAKQPAPLGRWPFPITPVEADEPSAASS